MIHSFWSWYKNRQKIQTSAHFLRTSQKLLRRNKRHLTDEAYSHIQEAFVALQQALQQRNLEKVEQTAKNVDSLLERHLGKYRPNPNRQFIESFLLALVVALSFRTFVLEAFKIPSGSMIPTLEIGDHIFVNKFIYGMRLPWTFTRFATIKTPERGEVVVFLYPHDRDKDYIKRVVGLPGDTVEVRNGQVWINQQAVERTPIAETCVYWDKDQEYQAWQKNPCEAFEEQLGAHRHRIIVAKNTEKRMPDFGPETVKPDHLFVMGDNRDNSSDSRIWGQVPMNHLKGRAMFVWWNWSHDGLNLHRLFQWID